MNVKHNNSKQAIRLPILIALTLCLGIFIGANMTSGEMETDDNIYNSLFKFRQVITHIDEFYVDEVQSEELVETAIENMLQELDPHSLYIPYEQQKIIGTQLEGTYEGIGVEFNIFRDTIFVVTPISGGPSKSLGILSGDKIIKVEGEVVAGIGIKNRGVIERLRGPADSEVTITILRGRKEIDYTIERGEIPQTSLDVAYMMDDKTGYIKISRFAATTYLEFKEAIFNLNDQGMENLILDLTGNGGGYMDPAAKMVDEFIGDGKMIVYTKGKLERSNFSLKSKFEGDFEKGALIVLIDEGSASASEIVAGALQDHDRALLVGRRSFGKGLVQNYWELKDGSELRLTTSRYYTPSGRNIQKPYEAGNLDEYYREHYDRYRNGEMYSEDSIKVSDSLIFKTKAGRTVFGGGGIVPDYFVPLDTAGNSTLLTRIFNTSSIHEFTFEYAHTIEKELQEMGLEKFMSTYEVSDGTLEDLLKKAKSNGVTIDRGQFNSSKNLLRIYVKAFIARNIWENQGFYPILNQQDEIVQKAKILITEAQELSN
ncbi:MAG: S41 family peptidase [Cytophagales bacterium]|nr:S41 family peptidase [Cytophagales bacterium]